jgi:hypothetical protein
MENDIVILLSDGAANNLDDVTFSECIQNHVDANGNLADP